MKGLGYIEREALLELQDIEQDLKFLVIWTKVTSCPHALSVFG